MVKHEDARSSRRRLQETLGLWIVDALDLVVVIEIMHRAAMPHQFEALTVEAYFTDDRPGIAYRYFDFHIADVRPRLVCRRIIGVRPWSRRSRRQIVDDGFGNHKAFDNHGMAHDDLRLIVIQYYWTMKT